MYPKHLFSHPSMLAVRDDSRVEQSKTSWPQAEYGKILTIGLILEFLV